ARGRKGPLDGRPLRRAEAVGGEGGAVRGSRDAGTGPPPEGPRADSRGGEGPAVVPGAARPGGVRLRRRRRPVALRSAAELVRLRGRGGAVARPAAPAAPADDAGGRLLRVPRPAQQGRAPARDLRGDLRRPVGGARGLTGPPRRRPGGGLPDQDRRAAPASRPSPPRRGGRAVLRRPAAD